jgi:hypothetical protein
MDGSVKNGPSSSSSSDPPFLPPPARFPLLPILFPFFVVFLFLARESLGLTMRSIASNTIRRIESIPSTPETTHMKRDATRRLILERIASGRMAKSWNQRPEISKREEPTETMVFCCVCPQLFNEENIEWFGVGVP